MSPVGCVDQEGSPIFQRGPIILFKLYQVIGPGFSQQYYTANFKSV